MVMRRLLLSEKVRYTGAAPRPGRTPRRAVAALAAASVLFASILLAPAPAIADDDRDYLIGNVAVTGILTLFKGIYDGNVRNLTDGVRTLFYGAVGGWGFYRAKKLAGTGHLTDGIALSYLSASFVENAADGVNPLAYIRYGIGPVDLNIVTPFADKKKPTFRVELNMVDTICFFAFATESGSGMQAKHGMLYFTTDEIEQDEDDDYDVLGAACGRTIIYENDTERSVIRHEFIHAIQFNQIEAVSAMNKYTFESDKLPGAGSTDYSVRYNWLYVADTVIFNTTTSYEDRWYEREAFQLAPDISK